MTVDELIIWLSNKPRNAKICYRDMNFGGALEDADLEEDFSFENGVILISSIQFDWID